MKYYLETCLVYGDTERGELFYQNDEDARRKFDNYPLTETNPGVNRGILGGLSNTVN